MTTPPCQYAVCTLLAWLESFHDWHRDWKFGQDWIFVDPLLNEFFIVLLQQVVQMISLKVAFFYTLCLESIWLSFFPSLFLVHLVHSEVMIPDIPFEIPFRTGGQTGR